MNCPATDDWDSKRGLLLQTATDQVVWLNIELAWKSPRWLDSPRGPGVSARMSWVPLLTFEQVLADVPAWIAIVQPSPWNAHDTARLEEALRS